MKQFPVGLVFEAHRLLYHSTLGSRVIKETKSTRGGQLRAPDSFSLIVWIISDICEQVRSSEISDSWIYERICRFANRLRNATDGTAHARSALSNSEEGTS